MAGMRDDSAGDYGQWLNPQDQSWLDYLKMKGSDVGEGAYNAFANITGGLSPIGTSPQGNMSLQVPPMVSGLMDAGKTIADRGGVGFSGVEEIDAPLKKAWADVLLTGYGGNALAGLTKPRGALGAGAMREASGLPMDQASRMARAREMGFDTDKQYYHGSQSGDIEAFDLGRANEGWRGSAVHVSESPDMAALYGGDGPNYPGAVYPLRVKSKNPADYQETRLTADNLTPEQLAKVQREWGATAENDLRVSYIMDALGGDQTNKILQGLGYDGLRDGSHLAVFDPRNIRSVNAAFDPAKADSANLLYSDNKPSILGAALATAGEQPIRAYHGTNGGFDQFNTDHVFFSTNPEMANVYSQLSAKDAGRRGLEEAPSVIPADLNFSNTMKSERGGAPVSDIQRALEGGHDSIDMGDGVYIALQRGTVKSPLTGETLFSRGVPLPPQQDDNLPDWLKF